MGRPKGSRNRRSIELLEMAQRLNADPIELMLRFIAAATVEVPQVDETGNVLLDDNGRPVLKHVPVTLDMKLDAAKAVAPYMYARLQSTQVTGQIESVHAHVALPTGKILADPKLADALGDLALMIAQGPDKPGN